MVRNDIHWFPREGETTGTVTLESTGEESTGKMPDGDSTSVDVDSNDPDDPEEGKVDSVTTVESVSNGTEHGNVRKTVVHINSKTGDTVKTNVYEKKSNESSTKYKKVKN